jgi:3-hydroxyisobutyrate dehydrogenase
MIRIGFIGLGNMGRPIAKGLLDKHFNILAYDVSSKALEAFEGPKTNLLEDIAKHSEVIITMLPSAQELMRLYEPQSSFFKALQPQTLLIDCSTIGPMASQEWHQLAFDTVDAPVSGGVKAAQTNQLTYMIGGLPQAVQKANAILKKIAKRTILTGGPASGQIAKVCNNLILANTMIAVSEAFLISEKLGLDAKKLYEVIQSSSGHSWVTEHYLPVPHVINNVPANHAYQPGFSNPMMLKDLKLANTAAEQFNLKLPLTQISQELYSKICESEKMHLDFSSIFEFLKEQSSYKKNK